MFSRFMQSTDRRFFIDRTIATGLFALTLMLPLGCNKPAAPTTGGAGGSGGSNSTASSSGQTASLASGETPKIAYVTNGIASFWTIAEKGALKAGEDLNCEVLVRMPPDGVADQKRMIEELLTVGVDGMAVSPIDPDNQTSLLNTAAENCTLITQDSDAPKSNRVAYIGMSNYDAGRMCGQLVKEALPDGGSIMIFVGRLEQLNAAQRRQGLIDELLDRSHDAERRDPNELIKGEKYTILDTRTDNFDFGAAKSQPEDAIAKYPDLSAMVGLFAYNPPYMIDALKGANKLGEIKVIGFDEDDRTLQAIEDGDCYGTVVQNPYRYGYESVKMLQAIARGEADAIPAGGFMDIPARKIVKDNVVEFRAELQELVGETE